MNKNLEKTFYTQYEDEFDKYTNNFICELEENDLEFLKISSEISLLKKDYPKVREVLEDDIVQPLDEHNIYGLVKINSLNQELDSIINKELFFRGGNEAINHLKVLGIL